MTLRVLHLVTSRTGGAGIAAVRIVEAQKSVGIDAALWDRESLVKNTGNVFANQISLRIKSPLLTLVQRSLIQSSSELMTPKSISLLGKIKEDQFDFDVINIHAFYNLLRIDDLLALDQFHKPIFLTLHDIRFLTGGCHAEMNCTQYLKSCHDCPKVNPPFKKIVSKTRVKTEQTLSSSRNINFISPSEWLASKLSETFNINPEKISVIPNPVPKSFIKFKRKTLDIGEAKKIVFGFAAFDVQSPYKGFTVFMRAIELLPNRIKARISICIQGSNIPDLSSFDNSNISVVCNKYSQMEDFYEGIDCLVVPSYADNYPSVATEAAASGCHLIVSNVGGLTEIAREFGGSIFRSGDYHQLHMLLRNLLEKGFSDIDSDSSSLSYSNSGNEYYRAYQRAVDRTQ